MKITPSRIGFVATHLNGIDHVSRESAFWQNALTEMGHECFFFTGESAQPEERTVIVPEADFRSKDIDQLNQELYAEGKRSSKISGTIQALRFHIKQHLHQFIQTFDINLLIVENALSYPVNLPLGLALTEVVAETGITCFARHHDFSWEHPQYKDSPAKDYIHSGFPPHHPAIRHIVATRAHADELAMRVGIHAHVIPYVRDFKEVSSYDLDTAMEFRDDLGISGQTRLVLSTAALNPSNQLDIILAMISRMEQQHELLLTTPATVQEQDYLKFIAETAELLNCRVHFAGDRLVTLMSDGPGITPALGRFYQNAAFACAMGSTQATASQAVDAMCFSRPLVTTRYNPALIDHKRLGIRYFEIDNAPRAEQIRALEGELQASEPLEQLIDENHKLGLQHFSLEILETKLSDLVRETLTA